MFKRARLASLSATVLLATSAFGALACSEEAADGSGGSGGTSSGGSMSTGGASSGGSSSADFPSDTTAAGITAFLESGTYETWSGDAAIREAGVGSPHSRVRVFYNPTLVASDEAGNGNVLDGEPAHTQGSVAVKELYDETDTLVGLAAMFRTEADQTSDSGWIYYCYGPSGECATGSEALTSADPFYEEDSLECSACHGSSVVTLND